MNFKDYSWKLFNAFQMSPIITGGIRRKLLQVLGTKIDNTTAIAEKVYIGSNKLVMGKHTMINVGVFLDGSAPIIFEDYARCGPYARILTGTHNYRFSVIRRHPGDPTLASSVVIKKGSWIGMSSVILPGITIAEGCIIAAGSVVTKDTEPNGMYAGNPAKRIKDLPITEDLQRSELLDEIS